MFQVIYDRYADSSHVFGLECVELADTKALGDWILKNYQEVKIVNILGHS